MHTHVVEKECAKQYQLRASVWASENAAHLFLMAVACDDDVGAWCLQLLAPIFWASTVHFERLIRQMHYESFASDVVVVNEDADNQVRGLGMHLDTSGCCVGVWIRPGCCTFG